MTHEEFIKELEEILLKYYSREFDSNEVKPEKGVYGLMFTERAADIDYDERLFFEINTEFDSNTLEYIDRIDGEEVQRIKFDSYEAALEDICHVTFDDLLNNFPSEFLDGMYLEYMKEQRDIWNKNRKNVL